jgi:hypothetical protein
MTVGRRGHADHMAIDRQHRRRGLLADLVRRVGYLHVVRRGRQMRRHYAHLRTLRRI